MYKWVGLTAQLALEDHPELAEHFDDALRIAGGAWKFDGVDKLAENAPVSAYTKKINGGLIGEKDREKRFAKVASVMGIAL
jgi:predicted chitinase